MTTKERLCRLLDEKFGVPLPPETEDATFEELDVDSLVLVEFALAVKKEFGILLDEQQRDTSHSITDIATIVDAKMAEIG